MAKRQADIALEFDIVGVGVADLHVRLGQAETILSGICYGRDAFGDLMRMALVLSTGGAGAECLFEREPDLWRVVVGRQNLQPDQIAITVYDLSQAAADGLGASGPLHFEGTCPADDFVAAINREAERLLQSYDLASYQSAWHWPFPMKAFKALQAARAVSGPTVAHGGPPPELPPWH